MKIGIFYGSTTGNTANIAGEIANALGVESGDVRNIADSGPEALGDYDVVIFGSSTWGLGELQDDWYAAIDKFAKLDLSGKKVAIFGCGDSFSYPDTFCNSIGAIYDALSNTGCAFIGAYEPEDYNVKDSAVCKGGKFVGLAIDDDDDESKTKSRIEKWTAQLKSELA